MKRGIRLRRTTGCAFADSAKAEGRLLHHPDDHFHRLLGSSLPAAARV
jgi:hypothetical protein